MSAMIEKSKRQLVTPSLDGCAYWDEKGKRITREEFIKEKPYNVTVQAMTEHLTALARWMKDMRETEAA